MLEWNCRILLCLFLFLLLFFPSFKLRLPTRKPQNSPALRFLYDALFLSLFPSLSLKLDKIDESSSLNSISCSVFADWLASTKKIRWYVLAESHYRFSILVARFVLFWGLVEFFFIDYDLGINFCYWVYVIIVLVCFDLGFQF